MTTLYEMHGLEGTAEYWIYRKILARCYNKNHSHYERYGGRGITVCDKWLSSVNSFVNDMGKRPAKGYEIERINNDKGYSPDNCRWATRQEQMNNTASNRFITYDGKKQTIAQWARELNVNYRVLYARIRRGWDVKKSIETPIKSEFTKT